MTNANTQKYLNTFNFKYKPFYTSGKKLGDKFGKSNCNCLKDAIGAQFLFCLSFSILNEDPLMNERFNNTQKSLILMI